MLFTRLGLDHLVDIVLGWNTNRPEDGGGNLPCKGSDEDFAGIQSRT